MGKNLKARNVSKIYRTILARIYHRFFLIGLVVKSSSFLFSQTRQIIRVYKIFVFLCWCIRRYMYECETLSFAFRGIDNSTSRPWLNYGQPSYVITLLPQDYIVARNIVPTAPPLVFLTGYREHTRRQSSLM